MTNNHYLTPAGDIAALPSEMLTDVLVPSSSQNLNLMYERAPMLNDMRPWPVGRGGMTTSRAWTVGGMSINVQQRC